MSAALAPSMTSIALDTLALVHGGLDLGPAKRIASKGVEWGTNGALACGGAGLLIGGATGAFGGPATAAAGAGIGAAAGTVVCGVGGLGAGLVTGAVDELKRR
jgi:hypothetical protein